MDRPGTGASNLVNALLVIALFLLGIVLVSFLMFRKSLRRLVRVRTQPCQLDISSSIESKLEQLNRLPPSPITRVSFHDALQTQALTTAVDQYYPLGNRNFNERRRSKRGYPVNCHNRRQTEIGLLVLG